MKYQRESSVNEEAKCHKLKSISPHFKPLSSQHHGSPLQTEVKRITSMPMLTFQNTNGEITTHRRTYRLATKGIKVGTEENIQSVHLPLNSSRLVALMKIKPMTSIIDVLPREVPAENFASTTSIENILDDIMPEPLILGPRITSLGQAISGECKGQLFVYKNSTAATLESRKLLKSRNGLGKKLNFNTMPLENSSQIFEGQKKS